MRSAPCGGEDSYCPGQGHRHRRATEPKFNTESSEGSYRISATYFWQRGHHAVVRPPIIAFWSGVRCRGHTPSRFHFWWISQSRGGSPNSGLIMRSDSVATKTVSLNKRARSALDKLPAILSGTTLARQRISSAIQFPIPANPLWRSRIDLIGARACRSRKVSKKVRSNDSEPMSGAPVRHQSGAERP